MFAKRPRGRDSPSYPFGMSARPGPYRADLDAAVADLALQVNRDTVLKARAALLAEADRLDRELTRIRVNPHIGRCGNDPVSPEAQAAFNERIDALYDNCWRYNQDLREAANALDATARSYGYTEAEIADSFRPQW